MERLASNSAAGVARPLVVRLALFGQLGLTLLFRSLLVETGIFQRRMLRSMRLSGRLVLYRPGIRLLLLFEALLIRLLLRLILLRLLLRLLLLRLILLRLLLRLLCLRH